MAWWRRDNPTSYDFDALDKIEDAMYGMIRKHPFFAHVALGLRLREDTQGELPCPTCGVDGVSMIYNPKWIKSLSATELEGVIAHEVLHVAYLHPFRRGERDPERFNMACLGLGTMITMADGSRRPIERVQVGEYTWSPFGPNEVLGRVSAGIKPCLTMQGSSGIIHLTGDHRILTEDGFINAECLPDSASDRALHARGYRLCAGQLPVHDHEGAERAHRMGLRLDSAMALQARAGGQPLHHQAAEPQSHGEYGAGGLYLSGRDDRRGRDDHGHEIQARLFQAGGAGIQLLTQANGLADGARLQRDHAETSRGYCVEYDDVLVRLESGAIASISGALASDQEASGPSSAGAYLAAREGWFSRWNAAARRRDFGRDSGVESVLLSRNHGPATDRPTYDLATRQGVIFAEGIAVHNCDIQVNSILARNNFSMPTLGVTDPNMLALAEGRSVEQIYDLLQSNPPKGGKGGANQDKNGQGWGYVMDGPGDGKDAEGNPMDSEDYEREAKKSLAKAAQRAKQMGKLPGDIESILEALFVSTFDWRDTLRRILGGGEVPEQTWARPNRRKIGDGDYMPGHGKYGPGAITLVLDSSGSIDDALAQKFLSEIRKVNEDLQPSCIHVIVCDAAVQWVETFGTFEDVTAKILGRGGTDFKPAFEYTEEHFPDTKALLYFTDTYGRFPDQAPAFPVLWIVWPGGGNSVPFGELLPMED